MKSMVIKFLTGLTMVAVLLSSGCSQTTSAPQIDAGLILSAQDVKSRFGIYADGKTNDTRGLQSYLDWCVKQKQPMVLPVGDYVIDQLVFDSPNGRSHELIVRGQGYNTRLFATGKAKYAIKMIGRGIQLRDFELSGKMIPAGQEASGIYMSNNFNMSGAEHIRVTDFPDGVAFHLGTPNWTLQFNTCEFRDSRVALMIGNDADVVPANRGMDSIGTGNMFTFWGCSIASSDTAIFIGRPMLADDTEVVSDRFNALSFRGCNISATNRILYAQRVRDNLTFEDCYFERNKGHKPKQPTPFWYFEFAHSGNLTVRGGHMYSACQGVVDASFAGSITLENITNHGSGLTINSDPDATYFKLTNVRRTYVRNLMMNKNGPGYIFKVKQFDKDPRGKGWGLGGDKMDIIVDNSRIRNAKGDAWQMQTDNPNDVNVYFYGTDRYEIIEELRKKYPKAMGYPTPPPSQTKASDNKEEYKRQQYK